MTCAVLVPQGKIALGKLAQALVHGARLLQVDGNFDDCLRARPRAGRRLPGRAGQLGQPGPHRGPEDRRVRDRRRARRRARHPLSCRSATRQHHRVLEGLPRVRRRRRRRRARRGCGASRPRAPRRSCAARPVAGPGDHRHRDPDRQPGVLDQARRRARRVRRPDRRGHRPADPRRLPAARRAGGRLRRAGVARRRSPGCCSATPQRPARRRASWSSAPSPATGSRTPRPRCASIAVDTDDGARRRRTAAAAVARPAARHERPCAARTVTRPGPGHQRQPRPGLRRLGLALGLLRRRGRHRRRSGRRRRGSRSTVDRRGRGRGPRRRAAPRRPRPARRARRARRAAPAGLRAALHQPHPARPRPGSSAAAVVAGLLAGRGAGRRTAPSRLDDDALLDLASAIEGHPDNAAACLLGGLTLAWTDGRRRARGPPRARAATCAPGRCVPPDRAGHRDRPRPAARRRCRTPTRRTPPAGPRCWSRR